MRALELYDYAVIRVVPRVEREEFVNAGVILSCQASGFLAAAVALDEARLLARALPVTALGFVSSVEFSVADTGGGISEAVAAELFTPFFTTKAEGMGLGLSLCRTVIEQHGSALQHQPQSPSGTVFSFRLPLAR